VRSSYSFFSIEVPLVIHPTFRELFAQSDDIGDTPGNTKERWEPLLADCNVDWSYFPDYPEMWWYSPDPLTIKEQKEVQLGGKDWQEPWEVFFQRVLEMEKWVLSRPEKFIAIITHGHVISVITGSSILPGEHSLWMIDNKPGHLCKL